MIAIDANLLVYAHVTSYPQYEAARTWLEDQLVRAPRVALPWVSLAFVRLVTNPRLFTEPESIGDAWAQVTAWLDAGPVWTPAPTARHRDALGACLAQPGLRANGHWPKNGPTGIWPPHTPGQLPSRLPSIESASQPANSTTLPPPLNPPLQKSVPGPAPTALPSPPAANCDQRYGTPGEPPTCDGGAARR